VAASSAVVGVGTATEGVETGAVAVPAPPFSSGGVGVEWVEALGAKPGEAVEEGQEETLERR